MVRKTSTSGQSRKNTIRERRQSCLSSAGEAGAPQMQRYQFNKE